MAKYVYRYLFQFKGETLDNRTGDNLLGEMVSVSEMEHFIVTDIKKFHE